MTLKQRRQVLLLIFGLLFAGLLLWFWLGAGAGTLAVEQQVAGPAGGGPLPMVVELKLEALESTPHELRAGRDPWRFERPVPPPVVPVSRPPKPPPRPVDSTPPVYVPPRPVPPPVDVVYLGSFGPASRRIAVFVDQEEVIYNAFEGEVLKGMFEVHQIGYESVDLLFVGFPDAPAERLAVGGT